ncbi:MAG: thioredoxin domain-containing protein [Coriobacteriia bacterium]|nr:thioredoxin domain-containing protein [Coriobacteriia bacterium]
MANHLANETSPYLLQHAHNPVDWFPWGDEAFDKALAEDKPVFLSVGYSACHWCHVMGHESFEDEATAALMNKCFISIKVDREERPDIDSVYMSAVQAMTGSGGWPMSVFLTPQAMPFYGGTYFPDKSRYGMPSFSEVLTQIASIWTNRRDEILEAGATLRRTLERDAASSTHASSLALETGVLDAATRGLLGSFDRRNGGWGDAPKFPQPAVVEFVIRRYLATGDAAVLGMATTTLDAMMHGGIYDQLGGGFHRYSTDEKWLIPHFEKMLYDNAQLARLNLHGWQVTGNEAYRRVACETLDYVVREMLDPTGGFFSAQDADSENEEGRFFLWTPDQVRAALAETSPGSDEDAELFIAAYGITASGNFEGKNILHVSASPQEVAQAFGLEAEDANRRLANARRTLLAARELRVRPFLDGKVLASWNGLMLAAFAEAARVLGRSDYLVVAENNAEFLLAQMRRPDGRMLRTWQDGGAKLNGYLEDYAFVADGLLGLYETTFEPRWFFAARELSDMIVEHFSDPAGGFFDASDDHEALIIRPKGLQDAAIPSGGAVATEMLLRMARLTGEQSYADLGETAAARVQQTAARSPLGFAQWLAALDFALAPRQEIAIVGEDWAPLLKVVRARYRPNLVIVAGNGEDSRGIALFEGRKALSGRAAAYVCRQFACEPPVNEPCELEGLLNSSV